MTSNPYPIILQKGNQPKHSIIWLHGLGADGHDFVPVADELMLPAAVRYVFPHAPMRPVTVNGGFVMRAWYDIKQLGAFESLNESSPQDTDGIRDSQALVKGLIAREMEQGIDPSNIFLAGFSQGGAIALHTALRLDVPIGGVVAMSTYLPLSSTIPQEMLTATKITPIFMAHGLNDPIIPCATGNTSKELLVGLGYEVEWHEYRMEHSVCQSELHDINIWLNARIE